MYKNLSIFEKTYELILWLYPTINKFPKSQRFVLGQQIENTILEILKGIIQTNQERSKLTFLKQISVDLDSAKLYGQDSWAGADEADCVVQGTTYWGDSGKAVQFSTSAISDQTRTITDTSSGTVYWAVRWDTIGTAGNVGGSIWDGANYMTYFNFKNDSETVKFQYLGNAVYNNLFTPTVDTWYVIRIIYDCADDQFDITYREEGGEFAAGDTNVAMGQVCTNIDTLKLFGDAHTGWVAYFDEVGTSDPTDPAGAAAGVNSVHVIVEE